MSLKRRTFFAQSVAAAVAFVAARKMAGQEASASMSGAPAKAPPADRVRPTQDPALAKEFVSVCHRDVEKVKTMLAQEPRLVYAAVDTGNIGIGDWETGLNGASHTGRRDIAEFLLANGARMDAFAAAMLGYREIVAAMLKAVPSTATVKGAHNFSLLYHAAISGDVAMAEAIKPHLPDDAKDLNQALTAAVREGRLEMTKWLLANGATEVNRVGSFKKTPLMLATEGGFDDVAKVLREHGAR